MLTVKCIDLQAFWAKGNKNPDMAEDRIKLQRFKAICKLFELHHLNQMIQI